MAARAAAVSAYFRGLPRARLPRAIGTSTAHGDAHEHTAHGTANGTTNGTPSATAIDFASSDARCTAAIAASGSIFFDQWRGGRDCS